MTKKPRPLDLEKWERQFNGAWDYDCLKEKRQIFISKKAFDDLKQGLKSACEFYLRYKDNPELLIKEHPEYKTICIEMGFTYSYLVEWKKRDFNEWLFKLAFKDVLEEGK